MPTDQLLALLAFLTATLGAVGAWLSKSYFPHRQKMQEAALAEQVKAREHDRSIAQQAADDQARQREHDRELAIAKAASDLEEEGALLKQMALLQTSLMAQSDQFSEFIIHLATTRADITDKTNREDIKITVEKWTTITGELREIRAALAVLVQKADFQGVDLRTTPDYLLEFITRQEVFYSQIQKLFGAKMTAAVIESESKG